MRFMHSETKRKVHFYFVLPSFFRNIGFAELTMHSAMKRKTDFSFALHSFFCNFAPYFLLIQHYNEHREHDADSDKDSRGAV